MKAIAQQIVVACLVLWLWTAFEGNTNRRWDETYSSAENAVVEVLADPSQGSDVVRSGTGFILMYSTHTVVVTNEHVIHGAHQIRLRFRDSIETNADLIDASETHDLAILRPKGVELARYHPLTPGNSNDLRIGDELMTIGHPLRESYHLSIGLFTGREAVEGIGTMLRLNMPVDHGNSGGPLVDDKGRVLGIIALKEASSSNIAFAVPVERVSDLHVPQ